jgi:hypothetical protein
LIVVILRFAKIIDDITEMKQERRAVGFRRRRAVERDLITDAQLVGVFPRVGGA